MFIFFILGGYSMIFFLILGCFFYFFLWWGWDYASGDGGIDWWNCCGRLAKLRFSSRVCSWGVRLRSSDSQTMVSCEDSKPYSAQ